LERIHYYKLEIERTAFAAAQAAHLFEVGVDQFEVGVEQMGPVAYCLCLVPLEICKGKVCNYANTRSGYRCYRVTVGMTVGHMEIELPLWLAIRLPQSR
jgi:hypothetical protein